MALQCSPLHEFGAWLRRSGDLMVLTSVTGCRWRSPSVSPARALFLVASDGTIQFTHCPPLFQVCTLQRPTVVDLVEGHADVRAATGGAEAGAGRGLQSTEVV